MRTTIFNLRALLFIVISICLAAESHAQSRLLGHGTQKTSIGEQKFLIEIEFEDEIVKPDLAALGVQRVGTIKIRTDARGLVAQKFYVTRKGDAREWSMLGFYVDKGYPATVRIDTWTEGKEFQIKDTFLPDWIMTGVITDIK
jgi:hypothetical protein